MEEAKAFGLGDFGEIAVLEPAGDDPRVALAAAAAEAEREGFDWLLAVSASETLAPSIFAITQPALRLHDAVWGGAAVVGADGSARYERITRLAAQDLPTFFHAALQWWIGPGHFVRPKLAREALRAADISGWYADYMLHLWRHARAYKTAQCLTHFHGPLPPVSAADRARLIGHLASEPVFMPIAEAGRTLKLPYTGENPVIEREQMRGLFFEEEELRYLAGRLPRGMRVLDVGANTGNHTLFFAAVMEAEVVLPVEPNPRSIAAIRATVSENGLANVDLSRLGTAVGAGKGRLRAVPSATAGLGAMHFVPDPAGTTDQTRLDDLAAGRVDFIKIDVEGMEMDVLAGAAELIAAQHPYLYVEVLDESIAEFMAWADQHGYCVEKLFPDKTHCNYLLVPKGRSTGVVG